MMRISRPAYLLLLLFALLADLPDRREAEDPAGAARLEKASEDLSAFGNARGVRNLFERALSRQADRLAGYEEITKEDLETLTKEDIEKA